jgi:putative SOS response-associated peptidase YedK
LLWEQKEGACSFQGNLYLIKRSIKFIAKLSYKSKFGMCFYNGISVSRAEYIRLMEIDIMLKDYDLSLIRPMQSGFDFTDWPVIKPVDGGRTAKLELMHWELIPHYFRSWKEVGQFRKGGLNPKTGKKDPPKNTLNAVGEEMLKKPTYRHAALKRRCLVLSSGFYEWRHFAPAGSKKDIAYPYWVTLKDREYFFMAGIWQPWTDQETGETLDTFAIVTTKANTLLDQIHNKKQRMPVILSDALAREWIRDGLSEERITEIATFQYPAAGMEAFTIEKAFRTSDDPTRPCEYVELPGLF